MSGKKDKLLRKEARLAIVRAMEQPDVRAAVAEQIEREQAQRESTSVTEWLFFVLATLVAVAIACAVIWAAGE